MSCTFLKKMSKIGSFTSYYNCIFGKSSYAFFNGKDSFLKQQQIRVEKTFFEGPPSNTEHLGLFSKVVQQRSNQNCLHCSWHGVRNAYVSKMVWVGFLDYCSHTSRQLCVSKKITEMLMCTCMYV